MKKEKQMKSLKKIFLREQKKERRKILKQQKNKQFLKNYKTCIRNMLKDLMICSVMMKL